MSRRVLILLENEPYPHDPRVRQEAQALTRAGCTVTVAAPAGLGFDTPMETIDGVRVLRYRSPPLGRGVLGYLREYGLAMHRLRRLCSRISREGGVDVVIVCTPPDFLVALALRLRRRGAAVVFDHHDLSPELYEHRFGRRGALHRLLCRVEKWAIHRADVLMETNEAYARMVQLRAGADPDRIFIVRQCPDPARIFPVEPREELRRGKRHMVVWMGMVADLQRVSALLDAADHLVNRRGRSDVLFTIVGHGSARAEVAEELDRRGLSHCFELPGRLDGEELRDTLATADVCVCVERPDAYSNLTTLTKVLDYMAMGRPVLQWRLEQMERLCGESTAYARAGDSRDLSNQLAVLLDDPARRHALGEAGRRRVADGLMWPDQVPVLLAAVERAVEHRQADSMSR